MVHVTHENARTLIKFWFAFSHAIPSFSTRMYPRKDVSVCVCVRVCVCVCVCARARGFMFMTLV